MAYVPAEHAEVGTAFEIDVRGKTRAAEVRPKPLYQQGDLNRWLTRATPPTCCTTPITTGRASTARTPRFGITWYAQDSLGEVVFFDPPEVGKQIEAGESYAEVESVKAVSDVIAPLSGEVVEVNEALGDAPETINERSLRRGLDGQDQGVRRLRAGGPDGRRRVPGQPGLAVPDPVGSGSTVKRQ